MPEVVGTLRTPRRATAPSSPALGGVYYDTVTNVLFWWNGTAWQSLVALAGGIYSAATGSNQVLGTSLADIPGFAVLTAKPGKYLIEAIADAQQTAAVTTVISLAATGTGVTLTDTTPGISTPGTGNGRTGVKTMGILTVPDVGGGAGPSGAGVKVQGYSTSGSATTVYAGNSVILATAITGPQGPPGSGFEWMLHLSRGTVNLAVGTSDISFTTEDYDTSGVVAVPITTFTVPSAGYYDLRATAGWAASATGSRILTIVTSAAGNIVDAQTGAQQAGIGTNQDVSDIRYLTAGSTVKAQVYHSHSTNLDLLNASLFIGKIVPGGAGIARVSALPTSPANGESVEWVPTDTDGGLRAHMRYVTGATYPWEYVGGHGYYAEDGTAQGSTAILPAGTVVMNPGWSIPHTGLWQLEWGGYVADNGIAGLVAIYLGPIVGASYAGQLGLFQTTIVGHGSTVGGVYRAVIAKSTVLYLGMSVTAGGHTAISYNRWMRLTPVRIVKD